MRLFRPLCLTLALLSAGTIARAAADSVPAAPLIPSQQLIPAVLPKACKAREAVIAHPTLPSYEIDQQIRTALQKAKEEFRSPQETLAKLRSLETALGPLQEIPSVELHQLLGALAGMEQRLQDQQYHRAYALALMLCLSRTGNGLTPETAYKVVLVSEEYSWFFMNQQQLTRLSRIARTLQDRRYDIWTVRYNDGREGQLYFDIQGPADSLMRQLEAARAAQAASAAASDAPR